MNLNPKDLKLEDCDGDDAYLLGCVQIAGVNHHVEFVQVRTRNGQQVAKNPAYQHKLSVVLDQFAEESFIPVVFRRRHYVVIITPYSP